MHNKIWKLKNRRWDTRLKETVVDVWSDVTGFETKKKYYEYKVQFYTAKNEKE